MAPNAIASGHLGMSISSSLVGSRASAMLAARGASELRRCRWGTLEDAVAASSS